MRYRVTPGFDKRLAWAIEQHRFVGTLADLTKNAGYSNHRLEKWLGGKQPNFVTVEDWRFAALCRLLEVSPEWLRWGRGKP
jgi:hypothetical protein